MGEAIITLPDGRRAKVSFQSREQLDAVVNELQGAEALKPQDAQDEPGLLERTGKEIARGAGLAGRVLVNAATAIPALATDAILQPINKIAGTNFMPAREALNQGLTESGLPAPANRTERVASAVSEALAGGAGSISTGANLATAAPGLAQRVGTVMAARPATQAAAAAGAGAGGSVAHEAGLPWWAQFAAGAVGGAAGAGGFEAAKAAGRGVAAMAQPFTRGGQERIVGNILHDESVAPGQAQKNLANVETIVADSPTTSGPASRDLGLLSLERRLRNSDPAEFAEVTSQQNTARQAALKDVTKTPAALEQAIERRERVTKPLREIAFRNTQGKPIASEMVVEKIDHMLANPDNAGSRTQSALKWAREQIDGKTDARALYAVRKELSDAIAGKVESDKSFLRYTANELRDVRSTIDDVIEAAAPQWRRYLTKYAALSKPVDRLAMLQEKAEGVVTAPTDVTGQRFISQAKWFQQITRDAELAAKLTPQQLEKLKLIGLDLDRGELINSKAVKPSGSDTANNITGANLVGAIFGKRGHQGPISGTVLARPFGWLSKIPEKQVRDLLVAAIKHPETAARLLAKATPNNVQKLSVKLKELATALGIGTLTSQSMPPSPQSEATQQ